MNLLGKQYNCIYTKTCLQCSLLDMNYIAVHNNKHFHLPGNLSINYGLYIISSQQF